MLLARPAFINSSATQSQWAAIFPQKATTTVCLGFCLHFYSMPGRPGLWSWLQVTVIVRLVGLWGGQGHPHPHSRRMETEGTAKVVASVWGAKFVQFLATLPVLPRSNWKKRCRSIWKTRLNSTLSFKSTKTKQPPNRRDDLCLCFCFHPSSMLAHHHAPATPVVRKIHNFSSVWPYKEWCIPLCPVGCHSFIT